MNLVELHAALRNDPTSIQLRVGRQRPRNLYANRGNDPDGLDIGRMDSVELAALVCDAVNAYRPRHAGLGLHSTVGELLAVGRDIWGPPDLTPSLAALVLAHVAGDLAGAARDGDLPGMQRELGNLILTGIRAAADLGLNLAEVLTAAERAQHDYAAREGR